MLKKFIPINVLLFIVLGLTAGGSVASYSFNPTARTVGEGDGTVTAGYVKVFNLGGQSENVTVFLKTGSSADVNGFFQQLFTFTPGGVDSLPFNLTITDDAIVEGTESLVFVLRNASNGGLAEADSLFTLTILDNDVAPNPVVAFSLGATTVSEGAGTVNVQVVITNPNANPTSVDINVLGGGTASPGGIDFSYAPITITFPANSSAPQNVVVTITDDVIAEPNETFTFQLNNATNGATIGSPAQHAVTITDNDVLQFDIHPAAFAQSENLGAVYIPVLLNHTSPNSTSVTLQMVSAGTTATPGVDFVFADTTITFLAGTSGTRQIPVDVVFDNQYELDEYVRFRLVNPTNGATFINDTFRLTIVNDDAAPSGDCANLFFSEYVHGSFTNQAIEIFNPTTSAIDLSDYRVLKSTNGGASTGVFGLCGILAPKAVYVAAHDPANTAIQNVADTLSTFFDFTGDDALALLHLNDTIDVIGQIGTQPVPGWTVDTGSTFFHTLIRSKYAYQGDSNWNNAAESWTVFPLDMFDSLGTHHIAPCGSTPPVPQATVRFVTASPTTPETSVLYTIEVEVVNPSGAPVTFAVGRDDLASTATANLDYIFINSTFTAPVGTSRDTVFLEVLDDVLLESTEVAVLRLINLGPNLVAIPDSVFTVTITDSDVLHVSFLGGGITRLENEGVVPVKVTLTAPSPDSTKVHVSLSLGSATLGVDFLFTDTTVVFPPNSIDTQMVWVTLIDDNLVEGSEQINFDLTNATNNSVMDITGYTLTIIDNDGTIGLSEFERDNAVQVFPNPVGQSMVIVSKQDMQQVSICDLLGHEVMPAFALTAGENRVDVSSLAAGMYFIAARLEDRFMTKRFIKAE